MAISHKVLITSNTRVEMINIPHHNCDTARAAGLAGSRVDCGPLHPVSKKQVNSCPSTGTLLKEGLIDEYKSKRRD